MELFTYATKQNEFYSINPAHIVGLASFISDDQTSARLEIHTSSSSLTIVREFDNPEDMKEEFERLERIIKGEKPQPRLKGRSATSSIIR
jgi:hypothetical protein